MAADDNDGMMPSLNVPDVMLAGLIAPLPILYGLTLPFGLALVLIGHPWLALGSCLANMAADTVAQRLYLRWKAQSAVLAEKTIFRRLGIVLGLRAAAAIAWPVAAVLTRGGSADLMFLGLMSCMLLAVAVAQGSLRPAMFWASGAPILAGLTVVALARFPLWQAVGLMVGLAMLVLMLLMLVGGVMRILGEWSELRLRNNRLIERLRAEREEAEAAREAARLATQAKSNFLATMSHEIRTPMNGVLGMAQLIKSSAETPEQGRRIDTLIQSGEFLMSILNDILDLSKIDAGQMKIDPQPLVLVDFADEMLRFWQPTADQKGVRLVLEIADDLPAAVLVDGRRLRQVAFNLLGNALKFTLKGSVTLKLAAEAETLRMTVADTGIGIDPNVLPTLFERFSQADGSTERQFGGAGLGLAISRQLSELMGGGLVAESTLGRGSSFHLTLPLLAADVVAEAAPRGPAEPCEGLHILVVDDNPVNLRVLDGLLTALGHKLTKAAGGQDALDHLAIRPYDLVLMDIHMPGMGGLEALNRLRAGRGPNRDTPVVAVTADVLTHDADSYRSQGFSGQVAKPIHVPSLIVAISEAMAEPPPALAAVNG